MAPGPARATLARPVDRRSSWSCSAAWATWPPTSRWRRSSRSPRSPAAVAPAPRLAGLPRGRRRVGPCRRWPRRTDRRPARLPGRGLRRRPLVAALAGRGGAARRLRSAPLVAAYVWLNRLRCRDARPRQHRRPTPSPSARSSPPRGRSAGRPSPRERYVASLVARAEQAERMAEREVELAARDERSRIAREMHDVVAHGLSVIVVQADGARYAAAKDPDVAVGHPGDDLRPPAARRSPRCAGCWGCSARATPGWRRNPAWTTYATSSTRPAPPACGSRPTCRCPHRPCPTASGWRPTGSCRRR